MRKPKTHNISVNTTTLISRKAVNSEDLRDAAMELANADLHLVDITEILANISQSHSEAIDRKTKAEQRLAKLRANLGISIKVANA